MSAIEQVITEAVTTDQRQVVLSIGQFPEEFYEHLDRVLAVQLGREAEGIRWRGPRTQFTLAVLTPKVAPVHTLYKRILGRLGPLDIAFHLRGYQQLIQEQSRWKNDVIAQALVLWGDVYTQQRQDAHRRQLLLNYFLQTCEDRALAELGLSRNIEGVEDRLFILRTLLTCMIGKTLKIGTGGQIGPACRVYLILDEAENILSLSEEACWALLHALELLTKDVGPGLTLWMDMKTGTAATLTQIQRRLGDRLLSEWITHLLS